MTEDLLTTLDKLRAAFRPVADKQAAEWAANGPAALEAFEATGATLDQLGGNCPVQAEGSVDGKRFYFRARGESWQFHVADTDKDILENDLFYHEDDYGDEFEAGWMPRHEALGFIVQAIGLYRARAAALQGEG